MRLTRRLGWLVAVVMVALTWASCGGASADGAIGPTGGELCLPEHKVCITVPAGGMDTQEILRIAPGGETPGGALSEGYDITASGKSYTFTKAATVSFSLDAVQADGIENLNLLRVYTKVDGDWQPLDKAFVDRVRNVVTGETMHLSPFVVLRSDRLPDGGLPVELDGGRHDSGIIDVPPFDAGRPDAGRPDSGTPDAGRDAGVDAGFDAGVDAGFDAGMDAGFDAGVDAGFDAGVDAGFDAGVDAGFDAGVDAGVDAGFDAGVDAGVDAGELDAGDDGGTDAG